MRYSREPRNKVRRVGAATTRTRGFALAGSGAPGGFFGAIHAETTAEDRRCGVLLVGGMSADDLVVRQAQAHQRYDRLPSYWSHAALILRWPQGASLDEVIGVEAALDPQTRSEQVPERNGVTLFRLSRYADRESYPHLAFSTLAVKGTRGPVDLKAAKDRIQEAVLNPMAEHLRFPLWGWLGLWAHYVRAPESEPNPVQQGLPLPAAALCEYAYEAAGFDLTPAATAPNATPELLWATALHWYDRVGEQVDGMRLWTSVQEAKGAVRKPLPDLATALDAMTGRTKRSTRKGRRKK
jgi:hypothetical protein